MTNIHDSAMRDADQKTGGNIARNLWMMLSGVGIIMLLGVITGFLSQHNAQGGGALDLAGVAVLGAIAAAILILAFVIWKLFQQGKQSGEKVPRREKVYNRFLIGGFLFGGVTGLAFALTGSFDAPETSLMSNAAMSPVLAIILSIAIGVILPAITLYWHRHAVDERGGRLSIWRPHRYLRILVLRASLVVSVARRHVTGGKWCNTLFYNNVCCSCRLVLEKVPLITGPISSKYTLTFN